MRRNLEIVRSARTAALQQQRRTATASSPFICSQCRKTNTIFPQSSSRAPVRPFSSNISRQKEASQAPASSSTSSTSAPPRREAITPQTHYDFFPETFPDGPPPRSPFSPDLKQLRKEYLQSQAKTHPDLAPAEQKRQAEALSMRVNEAYKTIQDPLKRAQYLLMQQGVDVEDESAKMGANELLMEVMEAREAVDEAESENDLVGLRDENDGRIAESVGILEQAFAVGDVNTAAKEAIRLRYWKNIEESIMGWEKGKGGGVIHH